MCSQRVEIASGVARNDRRSERRKRDGSTKKRQKEKYGEKTAERRDGVKEQER